MALYIPHSIFHLARFLYVRPETFGPYYIYSLPLLIEKLSELNTVFRYFCYKQISAVCKLDITITLVHKITENFPLI